VPNSLPKDCCAVLTLPYRPPPFVRSGGCPLRETTHLRATIAADVLHASWGGGGQTKPHNLAAHGARSTGSRVCCLEPADGSQPP
jgi:hypothetical protein